MERLRVRAMRGFSCAEEDLAVGGYFTGVKGFVCG